MNKPSFGVALNEMFWNVHHSVRDIYNALISLGEILAKLNTAFNKLTFSTDNSMQKLKEQEDRLDEHDKSIYGIELNIAKLGRTEI